ncbi:MAG: TlpA family protein disulfide reductase [Anaerolineae bacterium]|nr:TlpA family protein disulfide reductase [Anaerolineae bacterium]
MEQALPQKKGSLSSQRLLLIIGSALLLGLFIIMALNMGNLESTQLNGSQAPEFTLPLFDQFEQDEISLAELRGQVVVVNFWASWCVECYREADLLERAWRDYQDKGVVFLGVDYLDTEKEGLAYMEKYGITYPSGPDIGTKISKSYGLTGVPETIFIDKDGNIAHVQIGAIDEAQLYSLLDELVARPAEGT